MDTTLADPLVGRVLDGRYRVEARVAQGGMGTVYAAVDQRLDRRVAVKVMHPHYAADPDFVARFHGEAKAAARLTHPGVVGVFDQGRDGGVVFLVMEYVEGRTLRDLLAERGRLPAVRSLEVLEPVLAALAAAHAAGLMHRDVKPENVLLADDGQVKVADFGLVRAVQGGRRTASTTVLLGTVDYLAPEQVSPGVSDPRSDVYAVGVLLYELLTGAPPFAGETPMAVAYAHLHADVPPPSAAAPGVPAAVDALVARATARRPEARFADAAEFLGALRRVRAELGPAPLPDDRAATVPRRLPTARPTLVAAGPDRPAGSVALPHPRRRLGRLVALLVALATVAAAVLGWQLAVGRRTTVPPVLSLPQAQAEGRVRAAGLQVRWAVPRFDPTVPAQRVALEQPDPGRAAVRGDTVTLALSKGPEVHRLPRLAGRPVAAAQAALAADRLRAAVARRWSDTVPAGSVITTTPGSGTLLHPGALVTLRVSKGPRPVDLPDVTGAAYADARGALTAAGFAVTATQATSDVVAKGDVIRQQPATGTAPHGSTVALVVSKGPRLVAVPDVHGLSVDNARRTLDAAGFAVRVFAPFGIGTVHAQSPKGGEMAPHLSTVSLIAY